MSEGLFQLLSQVSDSLVFFCGFVTCTNSFLKPLKANEELEYFEKYKNGDNNARNILIERNLRLVAHIAKKYCNSSSDTDDFISIGTIGLIKALSSYDLDKGTKFATYAARCIENEILMYMRSNKRTKAEVSLNEPIGIDKDGNEIVLMDLMSDENGSVEEKVELSMLGGKLKNIMNKVLGKREKLILEMRYGLCSCGSKTQMEIAKLLGISRSYVSRIEKKALNKLNSKLKF